MVQSVVWGIGMCRMAVVHRGSVWYSELCGEGNVSGGSVGVCRA